MQQDDRLTCYLRGLRKRIHEENNSDLNITQVKVVHDIGHENLFKEGNVGIVLTLKERVAPGVDLITKITKLLAKAVFLH